ncbi:hypothetical protein BJ166DRAFT_496572 [Pestalotiopsis sp. NC0098]|nr:hypothetical protein BJ166DRAFT_496572 [Pestalotiopsis sp. NC0098]
MRNQFKAFWPVFSLLFAVTLAENIQVTTRADSSTADTRVGWYAGPTERGTLALVYSCLATIITCTWTVLHLNVPALKDGPWKKGFRKARWMAITILFPEFIFAKAICELRSALRDLFEFDKTIKIKHEGDLKCKASSPYEHDLEIIWSLKTKFPRGCVVDLIYPLMGLPCPGPLPSSKEESGITRDNLPGGADRAATSTEFQDWTLTHSYLANMGGLTYNNYWDSKIEPTCYTLTGAELSRRCVWLRDHHPLQSLVLSEDDIKDKSKADLLLKILSILQISWLVLTVIAKFILELPLTQLEIATLAFSLFAIVTFTANCKRDRLP